VGDLARLIRCSEQDVVTIDLGVSCQLGIRCKVDENRKVSEIGVDLIKVDGDLLAVAPIGVVPRSFSGR
jgi:hypothetical protein